MRSARGAACLNQAAPDRQGNHVGPTARLQLCLDRGDALLDGLFGVAQLTRDLAGGTTLRDELDYTQRAGVKFVVLVLLHLRSDPKPGRSRLDGRPELRDRNRLAANDSGHVVARCHVAWPIRLIAENDDRTGKVVATRRLARDHGDVRGVRGERTSAARSHRDEGRLLETRDEAGTQYFVLLDDRDANGAGTLVPANTWRFTGQPAVTPDSQTPNLDRALP